MGYLVNGQCYVSTHSRPKAAGKMLDTARLTKQFQHTAARRRLVRSYAKNNKRYWFQHTAARRRLAQHPTMIDIYVRFQHTAARRRLGPNDAIAQLSLYRFNTQPPEGGWHPIACSDLQSGVSTHSRPKAAGRKTSVSAVRQHVSTHSRPKAAGSRKP